MSTPRRRFRVDTLPADAPTWLDAAASHHLLRVLRLDVGAEVRVFDGSGREQTVEVVEVDGSRARVAPLGPPRQARPEREAHLVLALVKPKAMDVALRMAVEAGVTHLHVFRAARSVSRPPRLDRWERLLAAAAQQCGRADLPALAAYDHLTEALEALPDLPRFVALPDAPAHPPTQGAAAVIIGPEGGLTEREVSQATAADAQPLGLGAWTLRADTAAALASGWLCQTA